MIASSLDTDKGILYVRPTAPLEADDFTQLARAIDPWITDNGKLNALIIEALEFPGWDNLEAMVSHFRFVRDHHRLITKLAVVTNASFGVLAEKFADHFVAADIKHFPAGELEAARRWAEV